MANMMACFLGVALTAVATATQMATPELASGEAEAGARNPGLEQQLRTTLLSHLDPNVPPYTDGVSGVSVAMQLRIFKVLKVDTASGELQLKLWRRMVWFDLRLSWDPDSYAGQTVMIVRPGGPAALDNNIWVPAVELYNGINLVRASFDVGGAYVRHDGRVWYSVPGVIDLTCRYTGLVGFPLDTLKCPLEIGSWVYADAVVNLTYHSRDLRSPAGERVFSNFDYPYASGLYWGERGEPPPGGVDLASEGAAGAAIAAAVRDEVDAQIQAAVVDETANHQRVGLRTATRASGSFAELAREAGVEDSGLHRSSYVSVGSKYYVPDDPLPCAEFSAQSLASGSAYQEYEVTAVQCRKFRRIYPCCPGAWTALWLVVEIERHSGTFYLLTVILPSVLCTMLTWIPFLWEPRTRTGERMSFTATMLLTILFITTIVINTLPKCGELLWIQLLFWLNNAFCILALLYNAWVTSVIDYGSLFRPNQATIDERVALTHQADAWARRLVPATYALALSFIHGMSPRDMYETTFTRPMFSGFWPAADLKAGSLLAGLAVCLGLFALWTGLRMMRRRADGKHRPSPDVQHTA